MRHFMWLAIGACGGSGGARPMPSNVDVAPPSPLLVTDAAMDCTATTETAVAGNRDRFRFETDDGLHGYKDGKGTVVIAPTLRFAYEFKPGGIAAAVDGNGQFVFIDTSGRVLARAFAYDNGPDYFQEGFARIVDDHGRIGFISDRGVIPAKLQPHFTKAESFCNGMTKVEVNGAGAWVDRNGAPADPMHPPGDIARGI